MGVAKRRKDSEGAGRLDPSEGGEEEDEVTPLGSRPGPVHPGGGVCLRALASPSPGGPLPTTRCSPSQLAGVHSGLCPAARGPAGPSCAQESGQERRELTLAPHPSVVKRRRGPVPPGAQPGMAGGFAERSGAPATEARRCRDATRLGGPARAGAPGVTQSWVGFPVARPSRGRDPAPGFSTGPPCWFRELGGPGFRPHLASVSRAEGQRHPTPGECTQIRPPSSAPRVWRGRESRRRLRGPGPQPRPHVALTDSASRRRPLSEQR